MPVPGMPSLQAYLPLLGYDLSRKGFGCEDHLGVRVATSAP